MVKPSRRGAVVWVVLGLSLAASFLTFRTALQARRLAAEHRLSSRADRVRDVVTWRIKAYEHILLGAKGLFAASPEMHPDAWSSYVGSFDLAADFPGVHALVFMQRVTAAEKPAYLETMAALGHPGFAVVPAGEREEYFPNTFLVQPEGRTDRVYGFDGYQEPVRRRAMEEAWRSGRPALTGSMELRADSGRADPGGFAMYVPLYRDGASGRTPEERRASLRGFLSAFFRMRDLMAGLPGDLAGLPGDPAGEIGFRLHDGPPGAGDLMYATGTEPDGGYRVALDIPLAGRHWTLSAWEGPGLLSPAERRRPWEVLAAGLFASLLLSGITGSLVRTRSRADALATAMTLELRARSEQFRDLAGHAEAITQAKGHLLAEMGRELRSPLTRLIGCADLLLANRAGNLGKRDLTYLSRIRDDGGNLLARMDSILALARIEAGRMELDWSEVDLGALAAEAAAEAESLALGKGLEFAFEAPARCRPVRADAAKLKQVLLDLVGNAFQVMERGKVTLRIRAEGDGSQALEVEATADGFAPGGAGLGVALSRALVRLMGCDLEVSHRPGKGPVFSIRFPSYPPLSHPAALTPRPALRRAAGDAGLPDGPG